MQAVTFKVQGMTCGGCTASVTRALKSVQGVNDVTVTLQPGEATVAFDPAATDVATLRSTIENAGYDVAE